MTPRVPVAFYAPLKSPRHPAASGDRTMARLLVRALEAGGFAPDLASEIRTHEPTGDAERQHDIRSASLAEAERLLTGYLAARPDLRPRVWFTYHCYYKAPDWLGPVVADALRIPYMVAEGSYAAKREAGPWATGHRGAAAALDRADVLFVLTDNDREALARRRTDGGRLVDLPPFLDLRDWPEAPERRRETNVRLVTVAMMREGDKVASYRMLAEALGCLDRTGCSSWRLDIIGDGPARPELDGLFAPFGERVAFRGRIDDKVALAAAYAKADLFVWPAVNEAYGMVLLEAQACGCPVLVGHHGGVASALEVGRSGILTPPGDVAAFAGTLSALIGDPDRLAGMRIAARAFVARERDLAKAADIIRSALLRHLDGTMAA